MQQQNRGALIAGLILIMFGGLFLFFNLADRLLRSMDAGFSIWRFWPLILIVVGLAFFLPLLVWWSERKALIGLAMPGTLFLVNGCLLLYQSLSGNWDSWAWAWTLEPLAVALGFLLMYLLGTRESGFLAAAGVLGTVGLAFLVIFGSFFGGTLVRVLGPLLLIAGGVLLLLTRFIRPLGAG